MDGQHRTDPSPVLCRISALIETDIFDSIRIECGEETEKYVWVVNRGLIQHNQVMIRTAAPYVEPAREVRGCFHPGQELNGAENIRFCNRRKLFDQLGRHLCGTYIPGLFTLCFRLHNNLFDHHTFRNQLYIEPQIFAWFQRSEEHTSELQSRGHLVCRLLLEKKK